MLPRSARPVVALEIACVERRRDIVDLDLWYKNAVIYSIDVETFMDGNGDGIGDFEGLTRRLDYLVALGVTAIWLLPFYPTPNRDNGYDVLDFYGVDPRLGTLGDFVEFVHQAQMRGMRVLIDLVVNHTSDQHPWFQEARSSKDSPLRDYYVWSPERPEHAGTGMVFPGVQDTTWTRDRRTGEWYHHRFYPHQPDLNISNPAVRDEIRKVMGFWLQLGISGFRVDAVPFILERTDEDEADATQIHHYLNEFRDFLSWRGKDAVMLAEANVKPEQMLTYFGDGERVQMMFNFWVNQHLFLALVRGNAEPLMRGLTSLPAIPAQAQWANFLRNHDEIDLGRLSNFERDEIYEACGPKPEMQLYDRGIRRRLAPMLDGDERRICLALSLMFTLPGTPVLWYGDEIGMGDDLAQPERNSVRTPMQWTPESNGGFSTAPAKQMIRPAISRGPFAFSRVNAHHQERDPGSLMHEVQRMILERKVHRAFGWGTWRAVDASDNAVFALRAEYQDDCVVAVHNLSDRLCTVTLDLDGDEAERLIDTHGDRFYAPPKGGKVELEPYGYRWFRVGSLVP